jgi:hypothetical protein
MKSTLSELRILLSNLPKTLGLPSRSKTIYPFVGFELDPELLDRTGDEVGALNEQLKGAFGWKSRTTGDGIIPILERGEHICAVVDVLEKYMDRNPANAVLEKWVADITEGAKKVYREAGSEVCGIL